MHIRIELAESRSPYFRLVLRLCKQFPTYRTFEDNGILYHTVEFTERDFDSYEAIEQMVLGWKTAIFYLDGKLVTRAKVWDSMHKKRRDQAESLEAQIYKRRNEMPTLREFFGEN